MDLYMVRHGWAEARGGKADGERCLTPEGIEKTTEIAQGLERLECRPEVIASSPLRRAVETAEIMREVLCPGEIVDIQGFLAPGAKAKDLVKWLAGLKKRTAMIVGHNPDMPSMAAELLAGDSGPEIEFKKAAVCLISFDGRPAIAKGVLRWLIQPRQMQLIGSS